MIPNIPQTNQKRIVIIGAGFGGLAIAQKLAKHDFQIVLLDKNNYHQFQPLFYQVAMAGLEPSSIAFPLRKIFQNKKNVHIRVTKVNNINTTNNELETDLGIIYYDQLIIATGADTNFFGMQNMIDNAIPMKSISEAIYLRNRILQNFEDALVTDDLVEKTGLMSVVVVGGGPTGVEVSGTLAEMKKIILPKDYPELDFDLMKIYIFESSEELLEVMSDEASAKAREYLLNLGVIVKTGNKVTDFDGKYVYTNKDETIRCNNLVWAAGIKGNSIAGLPAEVFQRGNRIKVNAYSQVDGFDNIYAVGDIACMMNVEEEYPNGHPQIAQPAIQQGNLLAKNIVKIINNDTPTAFKYRNLGSMATVGRHLAVVDLPFWKFQGVFAWYAWMFVHLMAILGIKNKILIFVNWLWNYVTYDQSLRLIIKPKVLKQEDPIVKLNV
jgi:NADH:ubiquinone reductase (H+-translocating)